MPKPQHTLWGLLEHNSPSGLEGEAVSWLVGHMADLGYSHSYVDKAGNAIGVLGSGNKQIVLLGHIDTVPGEIPLRIEDDLIFGRGAVDAKGALAAFVQAAARLGPQEGWQVVVIGAVDEERESRGARYLVDQYQPEFAVIGEPSRWERVTLGYKGCANVEVQVHQPQAHSASKQVNAPEAAFQLWGQIKDWVNKYNQKRESQFEQLQISLGGFASGVEAYQTTAILQVGARLPLDLLPDDWYSQLSEICAPHRLTPMGFPVPAYRAGKNNPLVRAFLKAIRAQGGKPGFVLKSGTADLNIVAPVWGCPTLAYGPGDSNLDHTLNEHLSLNEFSKAADVLVDVLNNLTSSN